MMNLNIVFENLRKGNFKISKTDFETEFKNSIVNLVKFFSSNLFAVELSSNNTITDTYIRERFIKDLSPADIYSIINGAAPLIIEYRIEGPQLKGEDWMYEVWLNK